MLGSSKKDWCTLFPDKFLWFDWSHCCEHHDEDYSLLPDDSYDLEFFKLMADEELRVCVNKVLPVLGDLMYRGVRRFGRFFIK